MPMNRLREYLDEHEAEYVIISHSKAYTVPKKLHLRLTFQGIRLQKA